MTIIAGIPIERFRILVGDILLSAPGAADRTISIPTQDGINRLYSNDVEFKISGLRQKICVISDNLALAWAGSYIAARTIVADLSEQEKKNHFSVQSIVDFFDQLDPSFRAMGVSFILIVGNSVSKQAVFVGFNSAVYKSDLFGKVFYCGTGGDDFASIFKRIEQEFPTWTATLPSIGALDIASLVTSLLLIQDFTSLNSLTKYYGGGYEIAVWDEGKIAKEDHLNYLFWHTEFDNRVLRFFPMRIHTYTYADDVLAIRSIKMKKVDSTGIEATNDLDMVQPINRTYSDRELSELAIKHMGSFFSPSFLSGRFINLFEHKLGSNQYKYYYLSGQRPPIKVTSLGKPDKLNLHAEGWFLDEARRLIKG